VRKTLKLDDCKIVSASSRNATTNHRNVNYTEQLCYWILIFNKHPMGYEA